MMLIPTIIQHKICDDLVWETRREHSTITPVEAKMLQGQDGPSIEPLNDF